MVLSIEAKVEVEVEVEVEVGVEDLIPDPFQEYAGETRMTGG